MYFPKGYRKSWLLWFSLYENMLTLIFRKIPNYTLIYDWKILHFIINWKWP